MNGLWFILKTNIALNSPIWDWRVKDPLVFAGGGLLYCCRKGEGKDEFSGNT
jgi:hypothetical protein